MPGIIGIIKSNIHNDYKKQLEAATDLMFHYDFYKKDIIIETNNIVASKVDLDILSKKSMPITENNVYCWFSGEVYNLEELNTKFKSNFENFENLLITAYKENYLKEVLNITNGDFHCALYDKDKREIKLFSDRFGFKHLYIYKDENNFAWSAEIKAFQAFDDFKFELDKDFVFSFLDCRHPIGTNTPFQNVKLAHYSSIYTYKIDEKELSKEYYWKWSDIKPSNISFNKASQKLPGLLKDAIEKRIKHHNNIAVQISGGLDSRAILATVNKEKIKLAYTFGNENTVDTIIARQVSKTKQIPHQVDDYTKDDFLADQKFKTIWMTDGQFDLFHMHASDGVRRLKEDHGCDVTINGYWGDVIFGETFLYRENLEAKMTPHIAAKYYKNWIKLQDCTDDFYDIDKRTAYIFSSRGPRFISYGAHPNAIFFLKPFMDNDIIDFIFSLPEEYRVNNALYSKAMIKTYPKYFKYIPWSKDQKKLKVERYYTNPNFLQKATIKIAKMKHKFLELFSKPSEKIGTELIDKALYKEKEIVEKVKRILGSNTMFESETGINPYNEYWIPFLNGDNTYFSKATTSLTIEIYLQQFFNKKYLGENKP